jgi:hypothetical protein
MMRGGKIEEQWDPAGAKPPVKEAMKTLAAIPTTVTEVTTPLPDAPIVAKVKEINAVPEPFLSRIDPDDPALPSTLDEALSLVKSV